MTDFFRFPHTPHLAWLAPGTPRADKVLAATDVRELLSGEVIVEEKVDGANLGLSLGDGGDLRAQTRGHYIGPDDCRGQWSPLPRWLSTRRQALVAALGPHLVLFGEWCHAVHSVRYTRLPDWFLAFDVYDRSRSEFWSVERRNALALRLQLSTVPELGRGRFDVNALKGLLEHSALTAGSPEGLYVRREQGGHLQQRAKLVRAEFVQAIDEHWSKRPLEVNQLATAAS
jgi:ATP-dependent RNA circularization protein (DNA/RNA ligase family)